MKHFILFIAIVMVNPFSTTAQTVIQKGINKLMAKENQKAEDIYKDSGYMNYVEKMPEDHKDRTASILKIANSYRMNSKTAQAEYWYSQIIHKSNSADDYLHYAQVLQSNGKCEKAIEWFKKYQESEDTDADSSRKFIEDCDELDQIKDDPGVDFENVKIINSSHLDFSAIPYEDGVVFTSTRGKPRMTINIDSWTNDNFSDLFYATEDEEGALLEPTPLLGAVDAEFHDGTATFDQNKNMMIFTRNDKSKRKFSFANLFKKKNRAEKINLKIYASLKDEEEKWSTPTELKFNGKSFNTCHPTLSKDEKRLFFSSDRPGGYGGMDLYLAELKEGVWQDPINLGPEINTADNEIFPFISDDETLYFASNGHKGLGGLDVFKSTGVDSTWTTAENIGKPYNSISDDFGFFTNAENTKGYMSSNRKGGKGGDDIYKWSKNADFITKAICVYDSKTNDPVSDVKVTITERNEGKSNKVNEELLLTLKEVEGKDKEFVFAVNGATEEDIEERVMVLNTNNAGKLDYQIRQGSSYNVVIEKDGFSSFQKVIEAKDLLSKSEHCFPIKKSSCDNMKITVLEKETGIVLPEAMLTISNHADRIKRKYPLNDDGVYEMCMDNNNNYTVEASHVGYLSVQKMIPHGAHQDGENIVIYVSQPAVSQPAVASHYTPAPAPAPAPYIISPPTYVSPSPTYSTSPAPAPYIAPPAPQMANHYSPESVAKINELYAYFLGSANPGLVRPTTTTTTTVSPRETNYKRFEVNQVINVKDVYYDYDRSSLRIEGIKGLSHVYDLLEMYPSMEISLESHTDSRGNADYNQKLSQRRAKKARKYLVDRGIAPHRITYVGYGESSPKNSCVDDVECSEDEHQENRRTEIRITKLDDPVEVIYQD